MDAGLTVGLSPFIRLFTRSATGSSIVLCPSCELNSCGDRDIGASRSEIMGEEEGATTPASRRMLFSSLTSTVFAL